MLCYLEYLTSVSCVFVCVCDTRVLLSEKMKGKSIRKMFDRLLMIANGVPNKLIDNTKHIIVFELTISISDGIEPLRMNSRSDSFNLPLVFVKLLWMCSHLQSMHLYKPFSLLFAASYTFLHKKHNNFNKTELITSSYFIYLFYRSLFFCERYIQMLKCLRNSETFIQELFVCFSQMFALKWRDEWEKTEINWKKKPHNLQMRERETKIVWSFDIFEKRKRKNKQNQLIFLRLFCTAIKTSQWQIEIWNLWAKSIINKICQSDCECMRMCNWVE